MLNSHELRQAAKKAKLSSSNSNYALRVFFMVSCTSLVSLLLISGCPKLSHANDIVSIAESQIGKGEIGGNNEGFQVEEYTQGKRIPWCAAFVSWTIEQAGIKAPYLFYAKSFWKNYRTQRVSHPRRGDIIILDRRGGGINSGHVGIVESVRGNRLVTIEGNVGKYPAKVKRVTYNLNHIPNLIGFVRII